MNDSSDADPGPTRVLANDWEVLLARLLLRVCNTVAEADRDQEFLELYDSIKPLAEKTLRAAHRPKRLAVKGVPRGR